MISHQRFVSQYVDQARDTATAFVQRVTCAPLEQLAIAIAGDMQAVRDVFVQRRAPERLELVGEGDALAQLSNRGLVEGGLQLGLTEQHHLQQFALLGLKIGEQAQGFQ